MTEEITKSKIEIELEKKMTEKTKKELPTTNIGKLPKEKIIIEFGKATSQKDIEDLKLLLEDIREKYKFRWFINY